MARNPLEEPWGDLNAGDPTSYWEGLTEEASDNLVEFVRQDGPKVINRPIGSRLAPTAAQIEEWQAGRNDFGWWAPLFQQYLEQGHSQIQATWEILVHDVIDMQGIPWDVINSTAPVLTSISSRRNGTEEL